MRKSSFVTTLLVLIVLISGCVQQPVQEYVCDNGVCELGESFESCPEDCKKGSAAICGNGICEDVESFENCSRDCKKEAEKESAAVCGNDICEEGESIESCPKCKENCPEDCSDSTISWESMNGPPGGRVKDLIQDPSPPHGLYAITSEGILKSEDRGESWQLMEGSWDSGIDSMAFSEDKLFVCGDGIYYYDNDENLVKIFEKWCHKIIVSGNKLFVTSDDKENIKIEYDDLTSGNFDWKDISPSNSELSDLVLPPEGIGFYYSIKATGIVAIGNRILASIIVHVDGSGEFTNGHLYVSEDLGQTWSRVDLGAQPDVIIGSIAQDPSNPEHIVLSFKHNIVHEFMSPISELLRESYDGGRTWSPVTTLTVQSNGITDVDIVGSSYYLLSPYGGPNILKITGDNYEQFDTPRIVEFSEMSFGLDALLFDYDDPRVVYGQTGQIWALGILKSEDGMATWKKMDSDIIASSPTIIIAHPTDPNIVLTSGNVIQESYATRDWGETWEPFTPINAGDEAKIDPHNPDHILLISEMTDIYESYDSGRTFQRIAQDFPSAKIFDFEIAKDDPTKIYVSNIGVGISQSSTGNNWRYLTGSPDYTYDIEIDPENSDILYAAYSPKIFENHSSIWRYSKYQEENSGWSEILRVEDSRGVTSLTFDNSTSNNIYAGVIGEEGTVYVSNDRGNTWGKLNEDLSFTTIWGHSQLQIDPTNKNTVYAGTWGGGSYKTTDGGGSWTMMDEDHTFSPVCLAISSKNPDIVYACDRTLPKIHKSTDAGETWAEYYSFGGSYMLSSAIAIDPDDPDRIYASAFKPPMAHEGGLVVIENGQAIAIGEDLPRSVLEIEIDPNNKNIIYATTHIHGVYKSEDGGTIWEKLDDKNNGLPRIGVYDIDIDPTNSNILYATALCGELPDYMMPPPMLGIQNLDPDGKCGAYKSIDAGETWELLLETISEARGIDVDPENNNNLYVADMMGGVWVSNDAGQTWRQENDGLGSISMTSVKIKENHIYASTQGSGVYAGIINGDGSITWDIKRSNKPKAYVYKIQVEVDPTDSNKIYASAYPGGLLRSDDGGQHWNDKNFLTPSIKVSDPLIQGYYRFDINPENPNIVWMGVYGKGMFVSYDGMDFNMFANGDGNFMAGKHITSVKINPKNPDEIYVGAEEGIFVSRDNGGHWGELNNGLETLDIRSLKVTSVEWEPFRDNFDDGNADGWDLQEGWSVVKQGDNYVLQGVGHKWANADSESWTDYNFEFRVRLSQSRIHINVRKSDEGRYFLGFSEGGLSLSKQSDKWSELTDLVNSQGSYNSNQWYRFRIVLRGGDIQVYVDDALKMEYADPNPLPGGSVAFETLENFPTYVDDITVKKTVAAESVPYAGTGGYGIYMFDQASKKWQSLGRTFGGGFWSAWERRMYQFSSIMFDPDVPGRVYYGHFPSGFFISDDNGHTWRDSSLGLGNDGMFSLSMHPQNHSILFAGTYNGIAKSVDRGEMWELKSTGMPTEQWPYTIAIDDQNTDIMYTSTKNGQNKGLCHRNQDTFCGVVMKSTDGGESWFEIMTGLDGMSEFYTLLIYPFDHDILFLSTNKGVYLSRDAGSSWKSINSGLPSTGNQVRDNVADNLVLTSDNKYLVLGLVNHGAWKADLSNMVS